MSVKVTTQGSALLETQSAPPSRALAELATRGGVYLGLRYGLGLLVSFGNMFVLTRWIGPHAYGLFVTALGLSAFLANLTRAGTDTYLVRRESTPDVRLYQVAITLIGFASLFLMAVGIAAVPALERWYGTREFVAPYLATLFTIPLAGLAGPPTAKLERDLKFRCVAGIELTGQLLALVVSVILAWRQMGVWAPVAGLLAWQLWAALGALHAARLVPRVVFDWSAARSMLSFGLGYTISLRTLQLRTLVNPLLVGRFAGAEGVAYVALAIRIAEGLGFLRVAAARVAIAALSRLRSSPVGLRTALQNALELQVLTLGPLLCAFALAGPFFLPRVLGPRWMPSLSVYPMVAVGVLVNSVSNLQAAALFVVGQQWSVFRAYSIHVALLGVATLLLLPHFGIVGYGWADVAACAAYGVLHASLARRIRLSYRRLGCWILVFMPPLFTPLVRAPLSIALWLPLIVVTLFETRRVFHAGGTTIAREIHPTAGTRDATRVPVALGQTSEIVVPAD